MENVELRMKWLLRLEELGQLIVCIVLMAIMSAPWWCYVLLVIGPDIGMLGYLINSKIGALTYNLLHHKGLALICCLVTIMIARYNVGIPRNINLIGIILYGHASMDRIFGYGLKFGNSFHHTHLGWIGRKEN